MSETLYISQTLLAAGYTKGIHHHMCHTIVEDHNRRRWLHVHAVVSGDQAQEPLIAIGDCQL